MSSKKYAFVIEKGSSVFGSLLSNPHDFTGSVSITGSLRLNGEELLLSSQTGSITVVSSSYASTSSQAISSSYTLTASYALQSASSSYAISASHADSINAGLSISASSISVTNNIDTQFISAQSASFGYVESVTGSAVIIGQEYIVLNTQTPSARYAGLVVYDSGSTNSTSSLLWDSQTNHFVYENHSGSLYSGGGFMSGPRNSGSLSDVSYPRLNKIVRGQGGDHIYDSNITDDNTKVSISIPLEITGSVIATEGFTGSLFGTASWALNAITASYVPASAVVGLNLSQISTGSISANVNLGTASFELVSGSTSLLFVSSSGNVGIGTNTPAYKLDVNGSFRILGSSFSTSVDSSGRIGINTAPNPSYILNVTGQSIFNSQLTSGFQFLCSFIRPRFGGDEITIFTSSSPTYGVSFWQSYNDSDAFTTGTRSLIRAGITVNPTSGTAIRNQLLIDPIINQTGTASGISRGIQINPTLTTAADWRSIETTNNTGYALYLSGSAFNYLAGNVGIGITSSSYKLDVSGSSRISGLIDFVGSDVSLTPTTPVSNGQNAVLSFWGSANRFSNRVATIVGYNFGASDKNGLILQTRNGYGFAANALTIHPGPNLAHTNQSYIGINNIAPTVALELGTTTAGADQIINSTLGSNIAPAISTGNYITNVAYTISSGVYSKINTQAYYGGSIGLSLVVGNTYELSVNVNSWTSGNPTSIYIGGAQLLLISAIGTYTKKFVATNTQQLMIFGSNAIFSINAISVKLSSLGNLTVTKDLSVNGNFLAQNGTSAFTVRNDGNINIYNKTTLAPLGWNNGDVINFYVTPTAKLEIITDTLYSGNMLIFRSNLQPDVYWTNFYHSNGVLKISQQVSSTNYANPFVIDNGKILINTATNSGYQLDVNGTARVSGQLAVTGSTTAILGFGRGSNYTPTVVGSANNDILIGVDVNPTFSYGALTGITTYALRVRTTETGGGIYQEGVNANNYYQGTSTFQGNTNALNISRAKVFSDNEGYGTNLSQNYLSLYSGAGVLTASPQGGISIHSGTADTTVGTGVLLSLNSTTRGFRPPRLTTVQKNAIGTPVTGLMVYDSTLNQMSYYNGTTWIQGGGTITDSFGVTLDGQGGVISIGSKGFVTIPYNCTITDWYLSANIIGSMVMDIKRSGTSIIGAGNKPTLTSAISGNAAVSGWTSVAVTAGDIIEWNVDSATTISNVTLTIKVNR